MAEAPTVLGKHERDEGMDNVHAHNGQPSVSPDAARLDGGGDDDSSDDDVGPMPMPMLEQASGNEKRKKRKSTWAVFHQTPDVADAF